jgi:hypothetical protein
VTACVAVARALGRGLGFWVAVVPPEVVVVPPKVVVVEEGGRGVVM